MVSVGTALPYSFGWVRVNWAHGRGPEGTIRSGRRLFEWSAAVRGYLLSVVEARANGPRTVPVRSASEVRSGLENSADCAPDNPLRTGTVRGPMQRDDFAGLNRYGCAEHQPQQPASRRRWACAERFMQSTRCGWVFDHSRAPDRQFGSHPVLNLGVGLATKRHKNHKR